MDFTQLERELNNLKIIITLAFFIQLLANIVIIFYIPKIKKLIENLEFEEEEE